MTIYKGAVQAQVSLTARACANCGVLFAITEEFEERRREDGEDFYCPNGHSLVFRDSEAKRLRRELEEAQQRTNAAQAREQAERERRWRVESDLLDEVKKRKGMEKRIHAGVCPFCHRTFQQLQRHMASKHGSNKHEAAKPAKQEVDPQRKADARHGSYLGYYSDRCRCTECRDAARAYQRERRARKAQT